MIIQRKTINGSYSKIHESTYDVSNIEDMQDLSDLMNSDSTDDTIDIIDPDAQCEDDISINYLGKVILDCNVCHTKFYEDKENVVIDKETQCANVDQECPHCKCCDGFKIVGKVARYEEKSKDIDNEE